MNLEIIRGAFAPLIISRAVDRNIYTYKLI